MKKLFILLIVIFCIACSFKIYAFIDTTEPLIVEQQLSKTYTLENGEHFFINAPSGDTGEFKYTNRRNLRLFC